MTPSDRASVRALTADDVADCLVWTRSRPKVVDAALDAYATADKLNDLIGHPAPDPPSDELTANQIRDAIWPPVDSRKPLAWSAEDAIKRVLALLAAPRTEKP